MLQRKTINGTRVSTVEQSVLLPHKDIVQFIDFARHVYC